MRYNSFGGLVELATRMEDGATRMEDGRAMLSVADTGPVVETAAQGRSVQ